MTNRNETGANTRARANRYLTNKHDKKNYTRGAADCLAILFVCSAAAGWHWYREYNRSYLSVRRNVLRRRLSYESALNASSNEINMPDGSFRVIYGHGRDMENLREFVTNFSTPDLRREIIRINRLRVKHSRKPITLVKLT